MVSVEKKGFLTVNNSILLVDDDSRFRRMIATLLTSRGYEVLEAKNGAEGAMCIESVDPQMIIVDYNLPDCNGIAWIEEARQRGVGTPIVFLSGFACDSGMLVRLRNLLNVSAILRKPIKPFEFVSTIASILHKPVDRTGTKSVVVDSYTESDVCFKMDTETEMSLMIMQEEYGKELPALVESLAETLASYQRNPVSEKLK